MRDKVGLPDNATSITHILSRVFRKVVRLVIGTVSLPALVDILKAIYVEEAEKKLIREGSKPTKSALALITGLDTRVVSAVLAQKVDSENPNKTVNPEVALLETWNGDPYFCDEKTGKAALLPILGRGRTFQTLVLRSVGRNITVKTVMDRLTESGNIRIVNDDIERVELLSTVYRPISDDRIWQTEVGLLEASRVLAAVIHNMGSERELRVPQQGRWTYQLAPENHKQFRTRVRALLEKQIKEGEALLEEFEEPKKEAGQYTVGIGWYQWSEHEPEEEDE